MAEAPQVLEVFEMAVKEVSQALADFPLGFLPLILQICPGFSHSFPTSTVLPSCKGSNGSLARPKRGACVDVPRDVP